MNDLESPTPNNKQLRIGLGHPLPVDTKKFTTIFLLSLEAHIRLDPYINDITLKLNCAHGTLSMEFQTWPYRNQVYLYDVQPGTYCSIMKYWKRKFRGIYIIQVKNSPVVTTFYSMLALTTPRDLTIHEGKQKFSLNLILIRVF